MENMIMQKTHKDDKFFYISDERYVLCDVECCSKSDRVIRLKLFDKLQL